MPFYKRSKTIDGKMTITASSSNGLDIDLNSEAKNTRQVKEEFNSERDSSNSNVLEILPSENNSKTEQSSDDEGDQGSQAPAVKIANTVIRRSPTKT